MPSPAIIAPKGLSDRLTAIFWRRPRLLLGLLLAPPLIWLGVVYLGSLFALLGAFIGLQAALGQFLLAPVCLGLQSFLLTGTVLGQFFVGFAALNLGGLGTAAAGAIGVAHLAGVGINAAGDLGLGPGCRQDTSAPQGQQSSGLVVRWADQRCEAHGREAWA